MGRGEGHAAGRQQRPSVEDRKRNRYRIQSDEHPLPELPENLYDRPTLLWTLENRGAAKQKVEASYLAAQLSWSADYVLTVNRDETAADLDGWVTLVNNSGTEFQNARLQLVAGELNRVRRRRRRSGRWTRCPSRVAANAPAPFQQEAFNEYHLYTLGRRTSVMNSESKQISLLDASGVAAAEDVRSGRAAILLPQRAASRRADEGSRAGLLQIQERRKIEPRHAAARRNGARLPIGLARQHAIRRGRPHRAHAEGRGSEPAHRQRVRRGGRAQADRLQGTVGRRSTRWSTKSRCATTRTSPISVEVNEPIGGDWEIVSSTFPAKKTAAFAAQFAVPVDKDGTSVLRYRVRVRW